MMDYYNNAQAYEQRGVDWDLAACLEYNEQAGFKLDDIARVLAVYEGENDGADWRWILRLNNGKFVALQGGCNYTGWDCQSSADSGVVDTVAQALDWFRSVDRWYPKDANVITHLAKQLLGQKEDTWHQKTGKELGLL